MEGGRSYGDSNISNSNMQQGDINRHYNNTYNSYTYSYHYHSNSAPYGSSTSAWQGGVIPLSAEQPVPSAGTSDWQVAFRRKCEKKNCTDWETSIVDLLKGCDLPSGHTARAILADIFEVTVGEPGSGPRNMELHKRVMEQLHAWEGKLSPLLLDYKRFAKLHNAS